MSHFAKRKVCAICGRGGEGVFTRTRELQELGISGRDAHTMCITEARARKLAESGARKPGTKG